MLDVFLFSQAKRALQASPLADLFGVSAGLINAEIIILAEHRLSIHPDRVNRDLYHRPRGWATCVGAKNKTQGVPSHAGSDFRPQKLILIVNAVFVMILVWL